MGFTVSQVNQKNIATLLRKSWKMASENNLRKWILLKES